MPKGLQFRETANTLRGEIIIFTTTVDRIEQGNVTPADVKITFPKGCEITDAISGDAYTIGADGKPIKSTIEPLYGTDEISLPPEKRSITGYIITLISILLIACIFGYIHIRKNYDCIRWTGMNDWMNHYEKIHAILVFLLLEPILKNIYR